MCIKPATRYAYEAALATIQKEGDLLLIEALSALWIDIKIQLKWKIGEEPCRHDR